MKKYLFFLCMLISTLSVWAHDFEVNGIFYKIMTNTSVYVSYKGDNVIDFSDEYSGSINIPPTVTYNGKTYTVEGVWNNAFKYCTGVTSITIPNTVTTINQSAFSVTGITSIEIPSSVTTIGQDAFNSCESLKTAYIGGGTIQSSAFYYATKLEEVTLGNNVTEIQSVAFDETIIKTVTIEGNANPIVNENAFTYGLASTGATLIVPVGRLDEFKGKTGWTDFNVVEATKTLKLNYTSVELYAGDSFTLKAILLPNNVETTNVTWSSSNTSVATVKQGVVTALKEGTVEITATTADGTNLSAVCKFTIKPDPDLLAAYVQLNKTSVSLYANETTTLVATVYPVTAVNKKVTWSSSNTSVATVSSTGVVTAKSVGSATITATTTDGTNKTATCQVSVYATPATGISLNKTSATLKVNETVTLSATVTPTSATNRKVSWKSSDESVATVSSTGVVTAKSIGNANITATTTDGTNISATCKVSVVETPATGISLNKTAATLKANQTVSLTATVTPSTATNKKVSWKSSDESVAAVSSDGVVTAFKVGTTNITATTTDGTNLSATCQVTVEATLATGISLNKKAVTLEVDDNETLTVTVTPSDASNKKVNWKSSNTSVATVSSTGVVTAKAVGTANITATTTDGTSLSATCKVTVEPTLVTSLSLNRSVATLKTNETITLIANVFPTAAQNRTVTWSSSDTSVATVSSEGVVTALKVGTATITATTTDGSNLTATCKVTVVETPATGISLNKTTASLKATETVTLTATVTPSTTTNKAVTWKSSDETIATVSNGVVTAHKVGTADITATTTDGSNLSATCKVTVVATAATGISLNKTTASLKANETVTLTATVTPSTATNKSVIWSSSNTSVATVSSTGVVTAKAVGTATITATTTDGSNKTATCQVTVVETPATGISLNKTTASLKATETVTLTATIKPSTATNKNVTWKSSNTSVATVSSTGVVTAKAVGTATITATTADGSNLSATCKVTVVETPVTGITLNKTTASLKANETVTLTATVTPSTATNKSVTWSSSNTSVATVSSTGVVTAKAVGTATITATTADGSNLSATCKVTVVETPATGISLNKTTASLKATETVTLTATVTPSTTTNKSVIWTSSDETVATVKDGVVTAHKVGTANIIVTTTDGSNLSATCKVTVVETLATGISLDKTTATLKASEIVTLTATVTPSTATNKNVTWSSSNETVATVKDGVVTAHKVGTATIIATTADGSNLTATCQVTVEATIAKTMTLDKTNVTLKATESVTLIANITPESTTNKELSWISSDESVATVKDGVVTAHKVGTANIIVTTTDGSNLTAICKVNVERTSAETLTLDKTNVTLKATETVTIIANITPANTTNKELSWISSDESVATVKDGVVTAHKIGTANIIVTTTDGSNLTAICKVTVEATPAERVEIKTPETTTLVVGETLQLEAIVYPETATDKTVTWVSTNENIAKIDDNGVVTAVGIGKVKIMVIDSFGHSAFIDLEVIPLLVETLELDSTNISANVDDVVTLVANVYPINATNKELKWSVDDSNILSIESNENVATITILQEGTATITVETLDGSNLIATCVVNAVSAIDDILTDDKENAVYYTLDGTMVAKENLVPGLYIKKTSTKCTKVIIK